MARYFSMDGYVCGKIETRTTQSGKQLTEFGINSPDRKEIDGEWKSIPNFFNCIYWHHGDHDWRADAIKDRAHIHISGQPRYEEWEKDGHKRSAIKFYVDNLFLIAGKNSAPAQNTDASVYDEDIPF